MRSAIAIALGLAAWPVMAQQAAKSVSPGMSKAQVIAALGEPLTSRDASDFTYVFYKNNCEKKCGVNDVVVLHRDSVVDAIFRSPDRHYTGISSSPAPISSQAAAHRDGAPVVERPKAAPPKATKTPEPRTTKMKPAPASDIRPSIPVKPPLLRSGPPGKAAAPTKPAPKPAPTTTKKP